jgi:hypothetical protein
MSTSDQSRTNYDYLEKGLYLTATPMDTPLVESAPITMVGN